MIDTTQLTQLISAFRVETEKESISPETVGALLQNITDLLANASSTTEQQIFENWKAILSQLNLVESVEQGVSNVEHVNIAMTLRDLANAGRTGQNFAIASATAQRAGVMTAQQAQTLAALDDAVDALQLAAVNLANKNTEQDAKLDTIQSRNTVITAVEQGTANAVKVNITIRKESLATGEVFVKTNSRQIEAATSEKAGVMTKYHVAALENATERIAAIQEHVELLRQPQLYVTGVYLRPPSKDNVNLGVEFTDVWTGEIIEAGDDIQIPGATATQAGVMTTRHVAAMDEMQRDIYNLKKAGGTAAAPMFSIAVEVSDEQGGKALFVRGAQQLLAMGYMPVLFRRSKKRNGNPHDNLHGPTLKGWHRVGQGSAITIDADGMVRIDIKALKHTEIDVDAEEERYQSEARWFVNDREKNGYRFASFGKSRIRITYRNANRELKTHKVRLTFGIAFSKQETRPREKFDMGSLVSNMAVFHVATDPKEQGTRYTWIFEK